MRRSPVTAWSTTVLAAALLGTATLSGCASSPGASGTPEDPLQVVAAFYPLEWMAEQVGGDRVEVTSLTKPGGEPHDLELNPSDVAAVQDADAVAYLSGFQPAVDTAVEEAQGIIFDAKGEADLDLSVTVEPVGDQDGGDQGMDPHFWLDPHRMGQAARTFAAKLGKRDPDHSDDYRENAEALVKKLDALDMELKNGLNPCGSNNLVTSHAAFGYFAKRYGFQQVGITGLSPENEPSPKELAAVADYIHDHDAGTIYFETGVSHDVAQTLAEETGSEESMLTTLETVSPDGADYFDAMRLNFQRIQEGQRCS